MKKVLSIVFFLMTTLCTFGQVFTDDLHVTSGQAELPTTLRRKWS